MSGADFSPAIGTIKALVIAFVRYQRSLIARGDPDALGARTLEGYRLALEGPICDAFGTMAPRQIKASHLAQYLMWAKEQGRGIAANRDLAALSSAFNFGLAVGAVDANPCRGVRRNKERPRTRAVSVSEVNDLLALAKETSDAAHMVALIAVTVALTGRRRSEILSLDAQAVKAEGIITEDHKTRRHGERRYLIRWSPLLRQVVETAREIRPGPADGPLFPTRFGTPYTDQGFKALWNRLMHAYEKKHGDRFRAHDLRALYVSAMLDRGEDPNTHANAQTMRRVYDRRRLIEVKPMA